MIKTYFKHNLQLKEFLLYIDIQSNGRYFFQSTSNEEKNSLFDVSSQSVTLSRPQTPAQSPPHWWTQSAPWPCYWGCLRHTSPAASSCLKRRRSISTGWNRSSLLGVCRCSSPRIHLKRRREKPARLVPVQQLQVCQSFQNLTPQMKFNCYRFLWSLGDSNWSKVSLCKFCSESNIE